MAQKNKKTRVRTLLGEVKIVASDNDLKQIYPWGSGNYRIPVIHLTECEKQLDILEEKILDC